MAGRKNQTSQKTNAFLEKYARENRIVKEDNGFSKTVNWATSEEIEGLKKPTITDYYNAKSARKTKKIAEENIIIRDNEKRLCFIFRNSLNMLDIGNGPKGIENNTNKKTFESKISKASMQDTKVCVVYGGDLFGVEWEQKYLNNAGIVTKLNKVTDEAVRFALFFGTDERIKAIERDIKFSLSKGLDVYLFNGAQEHRVSERFKVDILQYFVDIINDDRLHYVKGVNTIMNVVKYEENGMKKTASIGFMTNNSLSKASKSSAVISAVRTNNGTNDADVVYVTNTNITGKKDKNVYYVSGEAEYNNTPRGKYPQFSPSDYNVFYMTVPDNHEITVSCGNSMPKIDPLERKVYDEMMEKKCTAKAVAKNLSVIIENTAYDGRGQSFDKVKFLQHLEAKKEKEIQTKENKEQQPNENEGDESYAK